MPRDDWAKLKRMDAARKAIRDGRAYFVGKPKRKRRASGRRLNHKVVKLMQWIEQAPTDKALDAAARAVRAAIGQMKAKDYMRLIAAGATRREAIKMAAVRAAAEAESGATTERMTNDPQRQVASASVSALAKVRT